MGDLVRERMFSAQTSGSDIFFFLKYNGVRIVFQHYRP